ncbi:MAG: hypothetical protein JWM28_2404 [Chitinophagaceae bacterium]|nr:hypothetical protein [Chitinophagaceae bacterium]
MELDALKEIWKDAGAKSGPPHENAEIMEMLNKSSKSPVAKMIHNVLAEAIFIIVLFGGVAIYYFIAFKGMFNSVAWLYIITAWLCVFYYYRKWKLLHEMQCVACQVKSNLQRQVHTLDNYVRLYLLGGTALVPLLFIVLAVLFYYKFPTGAFSVIFPPIYKDTATVLVAWIGWVLSLTVVTAMTYVGNRWFINRLYGRHIRQLKQILDQMAEE